MDFSQALLHLKSEKAVYRSGWNATDQYVYLVPEGEYPATTKVAKQEFRDPGAESKNPVVLVPYGAYLAIKTVQGNVVPWLASQTDLLASDWKVKA